MTVFGKYSRYYNLLYRDKDYAAEADYTDSLIQKFCPGAKTILDLGCGTGQHDFFLSRKGYSLTGIDRSEKMISLARQHLSSSDVAAANPLVFLEGDIRTVRLGRVFDTVISLFHVMSYQISNEDLLSAFVTAREHLNNSGIFIFDCWYGPAVLTNRPEVRVKRLANEEISVLRIAEPIMHPNENVVDVNYQVKIREKGSDIDKNLQETHRMRYLFRPEVEAFLTWTGFDLLMTGEWMTESDANFDSWYVFFVAKKSSKQPC